MTAAEKARQAQKSNTYPKIPQKPQRKDFLNHTRFDEAMDYYELELVPKYHKAIEEYHNRDNQIYIQFKCDLFSKHNLTGHPKANRAFEMAWDMGHASGYEEVEQHFDELAELLK